MDNQAVFTSLYDPLDAEKQEARLITLEQASDENAPLCCGISTVSRL
jgi:hypothetical protein